MLLERNQQNVSQQLLDKSITNKLKVSSSTNALLNNQMFVDVFLIEDCEYVPLRKELLITPFVKHFKTITLINKFCLPVLGTIYLKRYISAQNLMVEGYVHSDLRKGLRIAPFVERFKTTSLKQLTCINTPN